MRRCPIRQAAKAAGKTRYFNGKPCPKGHVAERMVSTRGCVTCAQINRDKWLAADHGRMRAINRRATAKWRKSHPEKASQVSKDNYANRSPDTRLRYREKSREAWAAGDGEEQRRRNAENVKRWRQQYPERARAVDANKRAKRKAAPGIHTERDILDILTAQNFVCSACPADLNSVGYHVDHMVALARGGSNGPENLQCLCPTCNNRKGVKSMAEFLDMLQRAA